MPSNALPPLFANTAENKGAIPVVVAYIGASFIVLVSAIRLFLTIKKKQGFLLDDYAFYTGAVLAVVASITLERAVDEGLGQHSHALSPWQLDAYIKLTYITSLIGILAQSCAKVSVVYLYERLAPRQDRRGIAILLACIGVWVVFAIVGTAFGCNTTLTYAAKCATQGYLRYPIIATNLLTDLMLAMWMVPRLYKLQASRKHRLVPMLLMMSRLQVCCMQAAQIGYLAGVRNDPRFARDRTWNASTNWALSISVIHLSVLTASIPRINTFVADIGTKSSGLALTQRDYEHYKSSKSGSGNGSGNGSRNTNHWGSRSKSPSGKHGMLNSFRPDRPQQQTNEISHGSRRNSGEEIEMETRDTVETGSQSSLQRNAVYQNAVYQKTEFRWEEEYVGPADPADGRNTTQRSGRS